MGIHVEFNPDLALRAFGTKGRTTEECLPEKLEKKIYDLLKKIQKNYWLKGQIPLCKTGGNQNFSLEATHFATADNCLHTKGISQSIITDELIGINPIILNGDLSKIK